MSLFGEYEPKLQHRATDPETSAKAARRLKPTSAKSVLLQRYYSQDLTDEEAAEQTGLSLYTASKRCADLRRDGFIEPVGLKAGESGNDRMVCRITDAGRSAVFMFRFSSYKREPVERQRRGVDGEMA
jgi:hypothetical protein